MSTETRNPAPAATGNGAKESGQLTGKYTSHRRTGKSFWTKKRRVLLHLIRRPSLHMFQAEKIGEHVLRTTVATWEAEGIEIAREGITVPGWGGEPTYIKRYFLTPEQREVAIDRLARELQAAAMAESYEDAVRFITSGDKAAA